MKSNAPEARVRDQELNALMLEDSLPELLSLVGALDSQIYRGARDPKRMRNNARPRSVEGAEEHAEPITRCGNDIGGGDANAIEPHLDSR